MKMALIFFAAYCLFACSKTESVEPISPNPVFPPSGVKNEVEIVLNSIPDSVRVDRKLNIDFSIKSQNRDAFFYLTIDTVIPTYTISDWIDWSKVPEGVSQIPEEAILHVVRHGVKLQFQEKDLRRDILVNANTDYTINFNDPEVVGDYMLIFNLKSESGKVYKKEVRVKVVSPSVNIVIYDVDPWLKLGIYDKNFYEILNERYTFNPLSEPFVGKETDIVYTYECPKPGYPGEWTYPGLGLTVYLGQENAREFTYQTDESGINVFTNFDNDVKYRANTIPQKTGFHCLELTTYDKTVAGQFPLILKFTDYWGKETQKRLTLIAVETH